MRFTSLPADTKNHVGKFQIFSNYTKLAGMSAVIFLINKGEKPFVAIDNVASCRGSEYSYRSLELGEHECAQR